MSRFLVDTNIWIDSSRQHTPFDVFPTFWEEMAEGVRSGRIVLLDKVYDELVASSDGEPAKQWAKDLKPEVVGFDALAEYLDMMEWIGDAYAPHAFAAVASDKVADIFECAMAQKHRWTLVTTEKPQKKQDGQKVKIPDVCERYGVRTVKRLRFLRELGIRI